MRMHKGDEVAVIIVGPVDKNRALAEAVPQLEEFAVLNGYSGVEGVEAEEPAMWNTVDGEVRGIRVRAVVSAE